MVRRNIEKHRDCGRQTLRALQLKARQLQHIDIGHRLLEKIECGLAEIAAGQRIATVSPTHLIEQGRYGALAVRTGNRRERRTSFAGEQFDVGYDLDVSLAGIGQ